MEQTPTHRWQKYLTPDLGEVPVTQLVYQVGKVPNVSWDIPPAKPKRPVEVWVSQLDKIVVGQFAKSLAKKHRSIADIEARLTVLEKELVSLREQFRLEEEFDKKLAAEIDAIEGDPVEGDEPDLQDLLPSGEELDLLLEEYDR